MKGVDKAWDILRQTIKLGDVNNLNGNTYFGCTQKQLDVQEEEINYKTKQFSDYLKIHVCTTA